MHPTAMKYFCFIYMIGLTSPGFAQEAQTIRPALDTITVAFDLYELPYVHRQTAIDTSREGYQSLYAGNYLSFSGFAEAATESFEANMPVMEMDTQRYTDFQRDYEPTPAVEAILEDAENHEIVIINEAHHEPRHRVFTRSLLQGLYDRGYRHFGLETMVHYPGSDSAFAEMDYPTLGSGYYTREPNFSAMVAEAQAIGFRIFSYEAVGTDGPKMRELGQMRNIMAYRSRYPDGKLLLHVGYSHAMEGILGGAWEKALAQRLADTTGLDPLTIDQTLYREMADSTKEQFEYRHAVLDSVSVFKNAAGKVWSAGRSERGYDLHVFHPRTVYRHGRPDYVFTFGRKPVYLDLSGIDLEGPYLLQAYAVDDDMREAVPRDVIETSGEDERALALAPGRYRVLVISPAREQRVAEITVE